MSMNEHPLTCPNVPNVPKTRQYMNFYGVVREPLNCAYTLQDMYIYDIYIHFMYIHDMYIHFMYIHKLYMYA